MDKNELQKYWIDSSNTDSNAMYTLFNNGHYQWALFIGHLVIEKLLKAYYIKQIDIDFPRIHNLLRLAEEAGLILSDEQKDFLLEVTTFNIKARYPDYKMRFNKKATKDFSEKYIFKIMEFTKWLHSMING